jgi:hypothetical protein
MTGGWLSIDRPIQRRFPLRFRSESAPLVRTVNKAATKLALVSSLNPAPFGSSATLTATIKAVAPGAGTPSGSVVFSEGETVLAVVPLAVVPLSIRSIAGSGSS